MSDLVKRLREPTGLLHKPIMDEAADRIEALEAFVGKVRDKAAQFERAAEQDTHLGYVNAMRQAALNLRTIVAELDK